MKILRNFDVCPSLTFLALINFQSLNGTLVCRRLDCLITIIITPYHAVWTYCHSFSSLLYIGQWVTEHPTIMPTTVSFQPKNKKENRTVGHMILVSLILVAHIEKCACVRVICFCVFRDSVQSVVSTNPKPASSDIPLAGNVDARPRRPRRTSRCPLIPPRSSDSSIKSPPKDPNSVSSNDPPFLLFMHWA